MHKKDDLSYCNSTTKLEKKKPPFFVSFNDFLIMFSVSQNSPEQFYSNTQHDL